MMKKILLSNILIIVIMAATAQTRSLPTTSFVEAKSFNSQIRDTSTWDFELDFQDTSLLSDLIYINVDGHSDHPDVTALTGLNFSSAVWLILQFVGEPNFWAGSNSRFDPPGMANRWMIIPSVPVSEGAILRWQARSISFTNPIETSEDYEMYIISGEASSDTDFIDPPVFSVSGEEIIWTEHEISLAAFANDTVTIAFRHTSDNQAVLGLDNIRVGIPPPQPPYVLGDFEDAVDFSLNLSPWITIDVDSSTNYGIDGVSYPNKHIPMAFMAFNPGNTNPPLSTGYPREGSGDKYAACFAAKPVSQGGNGPNNDWLISPRLIVAENGKVSFWARSYVMTYGMERFKVAISTGNPEPSEFNSIISTPDHTLNTNYVEVDTAWTYFEYDISAWANDSVHVGINCVSDDAFIFFIDDITIDTTGHIGISEQKTSKINIYPNPVSDRLIIENARDMQIEIYNSIGAFIRKEYIGSQQSSIDVSKLPQGLYMLRIFSEKEQESFPLLIVH
ncbi:MAG: choice-of-anchor J domain-containing protein [Bacteroidota bacterium]|nr:choice-of-anchor J domain-containing protein [Bacteroidota bacterium]